MTIHTLYELVQHSVKSFASKVAFAMYGGEELSYAEVGTRVKHVQDLLIGAGLKAGDKVALLSSNMPNWCVSYLAVTSAGMVAVPILPDFSTEELEMIIAHSEAKALMVSDKLFAKLAKSTIESLHIVIRTKNLGVIASRPAAEKGAVGIPNPEDLAVIIYTSGTTSRPKGVMLSHANLCAQISMSAAIFPIFPDDTFLSVLPLAHTYECSIGMIYPFSMGARVVYLDRPPTASVLMPTLAEVRPSVMLIVPLIIEKIIKKNVLPKARIDSPRVIAYSPRVETDLTFITIPVDKTDKHEMSIERYVSRLTLKNIKAAVPRVQITTALTYLIALSLEQKTI